MIFLNKKEVSLKRRGILIPGSEPHIKRGSETQARLWAGIGIPAEVVVLSGIRAAKAMATLARSIRVTYEEANRTNWPWRKTIIENDSRTTQENIVSGFSVFREQKIDEILIISSWYHLPWIAFHVLVTGRKIIKCPVRFLAVPIFTRSAFRNAILDILNSLHISTPHRLFTKFKERALSLKTRQKPSFLLLLWWPFPLFV